MPRHPMSRRKWFRLPHGISSDVTLAVAARHAQLRRSDMLALWLALLDHAGQQTPAGSISNVDHDALALLLDLSPDQIATAIAALTGKKRLDKNGAITDWARHQPSSTPRVRVYRQRRTAVKIPPATPPRPTLPVADTPEAIAARRARLQQATQLRIGVKTPPSKKDRT